TIVWDRIKVLGYTASDTRTNVGDSVNIDVTLEYESDSTLLTDGSVLINGITATHQGNGVWRITEAYSHVVGVTYDTVTCSGNGEGITEVNQNDKSITVIWDTLMVELSVVDDRLNSGTPVQVTARITRAYDGSAVSSGSVALKFSETSATIAMTYSGNNGVWTASVSQTVVSLYKYYLFSVEDSQYDLFVVGKGVTLDGSAGHIDCGADSSLDLTSSLTISVWFYQESRGTGSYLLAKKTDNDAQYSLYIASDGSLKFIYYNGAIHEVSLEDAPNHPITVTLNEWHNIIVVVTGTSLHAWLDGVVLEDEALPVGLASFSTEHLYIGAQNTASGLADFFDGAISEVRIYANALSAAEAVALYHGCAPSSADPRLWLDRTSVHTDTTTWADRSGQGNDGLMNTNGVSMTNAEDMPPTSSMEYVQIIFDRIIVMGMSTDDSVINIATQSSCHVSLTYDYDGTYVTDGTVTINGVSATYSGVNGVWDFGETINDPTQKTYDTVSCSDNIYDITSVVQNGQSVTQMWDKVIITAMTVVDGRINVGATAEIHVTAELSHLDHALGSGDTLVIDGHTLLYDSMEGYFYYRPTETGVCQNTYTVGSATEATYGITALDTNGHSVSVIWDQVTVRGYSVADTRVNIGTQVTIQVTLEYEYDDTDVTDGTVTINGLTATYTGSNGVWYIQVTEDSVTAHIYNEVACSGNIYGITSVNQNGKSITVIWDQIVVQKYMVADDHMNVGDSIPIDVMLNYSYDSAPVVDGAVTINGVTATHQGNGVWRITRALSLVGDEVYNTVSCTGNAYGITAVDQNGQSQTVIWDRIWVVGYNVADTRVNIGTNVAVDVTLQYEYDNSSVVDGTIRVENIVASHQGG
ncbi:hypothetical protein DRQ26_06815, partial [bacterium]